MKRNIHNLLFSAALLLCCLTASAVGTQPSIGDGSQANPYQIATADDLVWFANHVNSGNASACAILTADITVNTGVLDSNGNLNGTPSNTWTPIGGQNGRDYSGEFNGDGHTISGLYFNDESVNNIGLFGKAVGNAHIHDLGISDSYFCGSSWVGGICGDFGGGRIENCWNGATVISNGNGSCAGGIAGSCWTGASIAGCYNTGKISCTGSSYGGISGVLAKNSNVDASVKDCFTLNSACGVICNDLRDNPVITNSDAKDAAAFASGEVCWLLNNGVTDGSQKWYQTLGGTDNLPVLDNSHGTVYYGYDGDVLTYSNSPLTPPSIDNVTYIDANGEPQTADNVFIIMNASEQVIWSAGWYVVQGADITLAKGAVCNGAVHLILADGAQLTATGGENQAGITVSGNGNSLTIYGQAAQSGQLIAQGGKHGAGIGGGYASGSNITVNGGIVTATGGQNGAGIGGGNGGNGSNIKVASSLTVFADNTNPPTIEILHTDDDIAPYIVALRYVIVNNNKTNAKDSAIAAINAAIEGVTNEDIIAIATNAIDAINAATSVDVINAIKEQALAAIASAKAIYNSALGEMGEPCEDCPSVEVTKGTKTIRLYNPDKVEFKKE